MEDDVYNGMFIPKGSLVFANIWYAPIPSNLICTHLLTISFVQEHAA